jgi:hypothetical protein
LLRSLGNSPAAIITYITDADTLASEAGRQLLGCSRLASSHDFPQHGCCCYYGFTIYDIAMADGAG